MHLSRTPLQMSTVTSAPPDPRRWHSLAVIALVQLMLLLDMTVVNVALERIQRDIHFAGAGCCSSSSRSAQKRSRFGAVFAVSA